MWNKKLLLFLVFLSYFSSTLFPMQQSFKEQDAIAEKQHWDAIKSTLWASLGYAAAGTALSLTARTKQLADNALSTDSAILGLGSLVCAGTAVGLAALTVYSITKSRTKYVDALRHDILKKKQEYARKRAPQEPTPNRKQWEHFKSSFWDGFSIAYAAAMVGTGHFVVGSVIEGKPGRIPPAIAIFLAFSVIDAPVAYFTSKWAREDVVNAIADDAVHMNVPHSTTARKNWMYLKSGIWRNVSVTSWLLSPLILPAVLAWYSSNWSREALIKAVKEDITTQPEENAQESITVVKS